MSLNDSKDAKAEGVKQPVKEIDSSPDGKISRRGFLKGLGISAAAVAAAGCAKDAKQELLPYAKGEVEQIPGVAVWYSSTCQECSANCGLRVRTREGRAVKVEGNPENPVNSGGLCGLGQASLQSTYDPDRVRQPLKRISSKGGRGIFAPISWDEALKQVVGYLSDRGARKVFLTGELGPAHSALAASLATGFGVNQISFDPLVPVNFAKAHELLFGSYAIPYLQLEQAEVVLNFGADFIETWLSPVQLARGLADGRRRKEQPLKLITCEPRLSLTGANSDGWYLTTPGSEVEIVKVYIKNLLDSGAGKDLPAPLLARLQILTADSSYAKAAQLSGIEAAKLQGIFAALQGAKSSLVLAGEAFGGSLALQVYVSLLNYILGNFSKTINQGALKRPQTKSAKVSAFKRDVLAGKVDLLMVHSANPAFNLAASEEFTAALAKVPLLVSFSSQLDETAQLADLILPANTALESWGDAQAYDGINSLAQPSMQPVYDTRDLGDILVDLAKQAGRPVKGSPENFEAFLKAAWRERFSSSSADFEQFWIEALERGGVFSSAQRLEQQRKRLPVRADSLDALPAEGEENLVSKNLLSGSDRSLLLGFASVKTFDGRAANRAWLQEIPDPITQVVWDAWVEINSARAKELGIERGDKVVLQNEKGAEIQLSAYPSDYVHPQVLAVPLGQGHEAYGRYAEQVSSGNVFSLLKPAGEQADSAGLFMATTVELAKAPERSPFVILQGGDSQLGRGLSQSVVVGGEHEHDHDHDHEHDHEHPHTHEAPPKQMYVQREHPLYEWGMTVDLNACTGCAACVVACYAENNIPVVGKEECAKGREMSWLRIERYQDGTPTEPEVNFLPMMCQQCHNAPCETVCPVYATSHTEEGLNGMIYNRCVGTRYCSNNCPYKVRRFNWRDYRPPEPMTWQLNPDVTKRSVGVMEKCNFCVQRINEGKDRAKDFGRLVLDGEVQPACVQSCPTKALTFGNLKDKASRVSQLSADERAYKVLDERVNTQPAVSYLKRVRQEVL